MSGLSSTPSRDAQGGVPVVDLVVVAAVAALSTLPLWLARFPIAQDLPAHVETAAQIRALWQGDPAVAASYVLHPPPWPNALPTLLLAPLLSVLDGLTAAKLLVAVGVVAWPVSITLLLRRFDRAPLLALLVVPTSFDLSFGYGFLHFVLGKPLWALALVAAVDVARGPGDGARASAGRFALVRLALVLALLFATHLMLFATAVPLCALLIVLCATTWKTRAKALLSTALGAAPAAWWASSQPPSSGGRTVYPGLVSSLTHLWDNLGDLHSGPVDAVPWIVCGAALVVAVVVSDKRAGGKDGGHGGVALAVVCACVVAFACFGPVRLPQVSVVAERFWSLGAALLVGVPPIALSRRARVVVVAAGLVAALVIAADLGARWRAFSKDDMGDFDDLLAQIPPGSKVATHYASPFSSQGNHNALWHWGKLAALRGSATDDNFAWRATCVVGLRPGVAPPPRPTLDDKGLAGWDFLLVRGRDVGLERKLRALPLTLVTSTGSWRLFRVSR